MTKRPKSDDLDAADTSDAIASASGEPKQGGEVLNLFRKGLKFTEELLAENERLRFRVANLENELENKKVQFPMGAEGEAIVATLRRQVQELEAERSRLLSSYQEVETSNRDYQARYAEIEEEHSNLANLYIASYQLHSTLSFREVVQVISEIVINLVGASHFRMMILDLPTDTLHAVAAEGVPLEGLKPIRVGEGPIGAVAKNRTRQVSDGKGDVPLAVIPLATVDALIGVIVIDELLVQKNGFTPVDHELFNLLGVHAATALLSGLLRDQVGDVGRAETLNVAHARRLLA